MATTQNTFNGNGSNLGPFSFTFKWLESTDIKVSVGGVLKTAGTHYNLQGLNYTTKTGGQVLFTAGNAPPNGTNNIRIYRDTDDEVLSAVFSSGSAIRAQDLNDNFTQNLYITQEATNNIASAVAGQIPDGAIGTTKLADGAVIDSKVTNIGSPKITFTQTGAGAVQRTVESKLKDVVSVKDFGAVGNGITDDTAAIQACFNSLENAFPNWFASNSTNGPAAVFFPRGLYKITDTIKVPKGLKIYGDNARNNGGSQLYQATAGKYIFDLYGFEYIDGNNNTRREADQLITDLFFRSVGGGIRMVATDYPSTSGFSPGSLRFDRLYFLDVNGGANFACIYVDTCEAVRNCTFDYVQSPAIRTGSCLDFSGNVCWGGYVSDTTLGSGAHIISNCEFVAGDGIAGATAGGVVHLGSSGGGDNTSSIQITNCKFSKIVGGPGGFGVYSTNKLGTLQVNNSLFTDMTFPAITLTGTTHNISIVGNIIKNVGSVAVTNVISLGTVQSGQITSNIIKGCTSGASNLIQATSISNCTIDTNSFVGNTRTTADVNVTTLATSAIRDNIHSGSSLVITTSTVDGPSFVQKQVSTQSGSVSSFVSNYTISRIDNSLLFNGIISRTSAGSFSANALNLIGQISDSKWYPSTAVFVPISVNDGTNWTTHAIAINTSGEVYLQVSSAGISWSTMTIYMNFPITANAAVI